ncbi:GTP pyrophosphokinase [Paenibacillus oleatilyticus]|uniref:GTP pyrophosphokinase family protein n=1 Tax=Paenibacillus oleatilyticus TaxID=2594886 RepID=A0ABV4VA75_9BACL
MSISVIDKFLSRYSREYDYYHKLALLCARQCENILDENGIRAIVTSRAKRPDRLREKLEKRDGEKPYTRVETVYEDIVDLAGVRIAIYFPKDREEIDKLINNTFYVHKKKIFPGSTVATYEKRFSGYWAYHYRVSLKEETLAGAHTRYDEGIIEIQVASVLMHAWAEVEHDLVYKPLSGALSDEEYKILDELNGLVLAGEIALERLQDAAKKRITENGRPFSSHYELSSFLYDSMKRNEKKGTIDPILGNTEILYYFLEKANLNEPNKIEAYITKLDPDTEKRNIVDQIVDYIISGNPEGYALYNEAKKEFNKKTHSHFMKENVKPSNKNSALGYFLSTWIAFEYLLSEIAKVRGFDSKTFPVYLLKDMNLLSKEIIYEVDHLRRLRNEVVHGVKIPEDETLFSAGQYIENLIGKMIKELPEELKPLIKYVIEKFDL